MLTGPGGGPGHCGSRRDPVPGILQRVHERLRDGRTVVFRLEAKKSSHSRAARFVHEGLVTALLVGLR